MRVAGDWNDWNGTAHPMRTLGSSGVWELFLPGVGSGQRYKFQVLGADVRLRTGKTSVHEFDKIRARGESCLERDLWSGV